MPKSKGGEEVPITVREMLRLAACAMMNFAFNVLAPVFSPAVGIVFAVGGIVFWILSLKQAASLRDRLVKHRVIAIAIAACLMALAIWTAQRSFSAYQRALQDYGCQTTGTATATGSGNIANTGCGNTFGK